MPSDVEIRYSLVEQLVLLLAGAQYDGIVALAPRSRVSPNEMRDAVEQYGAKLVPLPPVARELIEYVAIQHAEPPAWSVIVPLFSEEKGRSDLSLDLLLTRQSNGQYEAEVDDIHVL